MNPRLGINCARTRAWILSIEWPILTLVSRNSGQMVVGRSAASAHAMFLECYLWSVKNHCPAPHGSNCINWD